MFSSLYWISDKVVSTFSSNSSVIPLNFVLQLTILLLGFTSSSMITQKLQFMMDILANQNPCVVMTIQQSRQRIFSQIFSYFDVGVGMENTLQSGDDSIEGYLLSLSQYSQSLKDLYLLYRLWLQESYLSILLSSLILYPVSSQKQYQFTFWSLNVTLSPSCISPINSSIFSFIIH